MSLYRELMSQSTDVVEARVERIFIRRQRPRAGGGTPDADEALINTCLLDVRVIQTHKGSIHPEQRVFAEYWRHYALPRGFSGERGQKMDAREGDHVQLFMKQSSDGERYELLNPFGLEVFPPQH